MFFAPAYVWNMASLFSAEMLKTPKSGKLLKKENMYFMYFSVNSILRLICKKKCVK